MNTKIIKVNNREYQALETRNIIAAEKASGQFDFDVISCRHDGLMSKLFLKTGSYWDRRVLSGTFFYDLQNDLITYIYECLYDPQNILVVRPIVKALDDKDLVIVVMKKGNYIDRFRVKAGKLKDYIKDFSPYKVNVDINFFERIKSKAGQSGKKRK